MCENVDFLCFWVFVKIWILFQSQDGSDDHDSPCVWRPAPGSFSARGRADRKVSFCWSWIKTKNYFPFPETFWSIRTRRRDCLKPWMRTVPRSVLSRREIFFSSKFLLLLTTNIGWLFLLLSYIIEQQTCFLTLTERQFSKKTAYSFLEDLAGEFHSQYGHKINTATRPYSFIEFDTYIQVSTE